MFAVTMHTTPGLHGDTANRAVRQRVTQAPGVNRWSTNLLSPLTVLGAPNVSTITVRVAVSLGGSAPSRDCDSVRMPGDEQGMHAGHRVPPSQKVPESHIAGAANITWTYYSSTRVMGGAWEQSGTWTLGEAQAMCEAAAHCNAVVFAGNASTPARPVEMWLTSRVVTFDAPGWQTYTIAPPRPAPPPPAPAGALEGAWAGVCGRVATLAHAMPQGVCLSVNSTSWLLLENGTVVLGYGQHLGLGCGGSSTIGSVDVSLMLNGRAVQGSIGGVSVGSFTTNTVQGYVGLQSGYNEAEFDNFSYSGH